MVGKTHHVLIVDDDEWLAKHYARLLSAHKFEVSHAFHALQAIDMMDEKIPDVLVLDLMLPGPNALALLHELQSHSDFARVPVVLCSNSGADISINDVRPYGVRKVLDKTVMQPEDLVYAVRGALL